MQRKVKRMYRATRPGTKTKQKKRRNKENRRSKTTERLVDSKYGILSPSLQRLLCHALLTSCTPLTSRVPPHTSYEPSLFGWLGFRDRALPVFSSLNFDVCTWRPGLARFFATEISVTRVNSFPQENSSPEYRYLVPAHMKRPLKACASRLFMQARKHSTRMNLSVVCCRWDEWKRKPIRSPSNRKSNDKNSLYWTQNNNKGKSSDDFIDIILVRIKFITKTCTYYNDF